MSFWNSHGFSMIQQMLEILISGSSAFSKTSLNIWKFMVHVLLKPDLKNLSITVLACEMSATVWQFEHSLALPFFGIEMKTDLFQSRALICIQKKTDHFTMSFKTQPQSIINPITRALICIQKKTDHFTMSFKTQQQSIINPIIQPCQRQY